MNNILLKALDSTRKLISDYSSPKILLGLSGGPDSVFLFNVLLQLKKEGRIDFIAAHLDHEWREESKLDSDFCKKLCEENNIEIFISVASDLDVVLKDKGSKEDLGRGLRRYFFNKLALENNLDVIALAHHLNDQEETFFLRLLRGATLDGLVGMNPKEDRYIRPLLEISKKEILDYLNQNNIKYIYDISNESDTYLRNKIRKYVIPAFEKCDSRFDKKFMSSLNYLKEENSFIESLTLEHFNKVFYESDNKIIGNVDNFVTIPPVIQKRLIIIWLCKCKIFFEPSFGLINEVLKFISSPRGGSHLFYQAWKIRKKSKLFWIEKL